MPLSSSEPVEDKLKDVEVAQLARQGDLCILIVLTAGGKSGRRYGPLVRHGSANAFRLARTDREWPTLPQDSAAIADDNQVPDTVCRRSNILAKAARFITSSTPGCLLRRFITAGAEIG